MPSHPHENHLARVGEGSDMATFARGSVKWGAAGACGVLGLATVLAVNPIAATPSLASGLTPFDDCEQLRQSYATAALPLVTSWGLQGVGWGSPVMALGTAVDDSAVPAPAPGSEHASQAQTSVGNGDTGTNVQEPGVDEPDIAKTNGEIAVTVSGRLLRLYDVSGAQAEQTATVRLPRGTASNELMLVGDRVLVVGVQQGLVAWPMAEGAVPQPMPDEPQSAGSPSGPQLPDSAVSGVPATMWTPRSTLTTIDVSDPNAPTVVDQEVVDGTVLTSRTSDGVVRVVVSHQPTMKWVVPGPGITNRQALERNREIVRSASSSDWLPTASRDGVTSPLVDCADVLHPAISQHVLTTLTVLTIDPLDPRSSSSIGLVAGGDLVYASPDRLYVAAMEQNPTPFAATANDSAYHATTDIHAFSTTGFATQYVASGRVSGLVPSRWALSENDGVLRVASQTGDPWQPAETVVSTFSEQDGQLVRLGSVGGMGQGEQIKAVRWFGDMAVVVTFRQTDPLYTLDLSVPQTPRVVGELKMPGFSAYLHPVGGSLILGVGQSATRSGMTFGTQVSLFDLADLANPKRIALRSLGHNVYSAVENDSRAFTYLPDSGVALIPIDDYRGHSSLAMVTVGSDGTLSNVHSFDIDNSMGTGSRPTA